MFTSFRFCLRAGVFLGAIVLLSHSATAQTPHCFNSLSGPEVPCTPRSSGGSGGGYVAPAPSGPSPAEIARRKRIAAGNAANQRGAAARERGDLRAAVRYFEEAARLWPEDRKVQGNYWNAKGELAARDGNYAEAVSYYKSALRYYPGHKDIAARLKEAESGLKEAEYFASSKTATDLMSKGNWERARRYLEKAISSCAIRATLSFCSENESFRHWQAAGLALSHQDWRKAASELRKMSREGDEKIANPNEEQKNHINLLHDADSAIERGDIAVALSNYEKAAEIEKKWFGKAGMNPGPDPILLELRRQAALQAAHQSQQKDQGQASNPNSPNPPQVYRDASTPRGYPDLNSYTPAQHAAHKDNDDGNTWAQNGDWVQALLSYQKALTEDPDGPFAKVIKENLAIAMKHVGPQRANTVPAGAPPAIAVPTPAKTEEKPKEIVQANCTGWMTQADGSSFRLCTDERAQRYCEQSGQAGGQGDISRVSCQ